MGDWVQKLCEIVKSHHASTGQALLLSEASRLLRREGINLQESLGKRKLKDALIEHVETFRLVSNPARPLVWGVLPADAVIEGNLESLFGTHSISQRSGVLNTTNLPRFNRAVWLAFAKPLKANYRRFLEVGPPSRSYDVQENGEIPPAGIEIDPTFIYNRDNELIPGNNHSEIVGKNIEAWSENKGISISKLLSSYSNNDGKDSSYRFNYLDLSGLSQSDKARIIIPFDIIGKIIFGKN